MLEFLGRNSTQFLIFRSRHTYVDIIVPRYEPLMSDGAKKCTAIDEDLDIVLLTNGEQLVEQVYFYRPNPLLSGSDRILAPHFLLKESIIEVS
jgi:hypothetical protein